MFFTIALLLRFIFPLVSREGRSAWYLFSLPKPRTEILLSKVLLAVLSDIPLFLLALIVWRVLPFAAGYRQIMFGASIMIIFFLSLFQTFLGAIAPNFSLGHDPEKVSTSGMGILTLGLSVAVTAEACMLVSMMITGRISQFLMTGVLFAVGIFLTVLLWLTAGKAMQRYEW